MTGFADKKSMRLRMSWAVVVSGITIGVAGGVLKWLINTVSRLVTSGFDAAGGNWWLILVPVIGIVCTGLFVRKVVRTPLEHGTSRLKCDISTHSGQMPARLTVSSMIASTLTLGFGGSAGSEGPIAYTGAAIGSNIARLSGLGRRRMLIFMACGAGAGIAAIFKAPVGGIFFTIEVLGMALDVTSLLMLTVMCLLSGLTAYVISGCTTDMVVHPVVSTDLGILPTLIALGVVCGLYAAYYRRVGEAVAGRIRSVAPPLSRNIVSGLLLGIILLLFPAMYGEGYGVLTHLADGRLSAAVAGGLYVTLPDSDVILWTLAGIILLKPVACYLTNSGGGVAGDFAPALFAGGVAGAFATALSGQLQLPASVPAEVMVICGMAGVMSGVVRAPLMTIFIVVEMTHQSPLLLPVCVVVAVATGVSGLIECRQVKKN